ncbi:MAG: hypothetical protein ABIR91_01595 [Candidatus Saccharimonadales bacterium]
MTTTSTPSKHNSASLLMIVTAADEAAAAIATDYRAALDARELSPDEQNWEVGLDLAAYRAATIIFEAGSPTPTDVQSAIESYIDHISENDQQEWLATTDMHKHMTRALLERGLKLAKADKVFAFGPHSDGRAHEALDGPDAKYNKFCALIAA